MASTISLTGQMSNLQGIKPCPSSPSLCNSLSLWLSFLYSLLPVWLPRKLRKSGNIFPSVRIYGYMYWMGFWVLLCSVLYVGINHVLLPWICFMDIFCILCFSEFDWLNQVILMWVFCGWKFREVEQHYGSNGCFGFGGVKAVSPDREMGYLWKWLWFTQ